MLSFAKFGLIPYSKNIYVVKNTNSEIIESELLKKITRSRSSANFLSQKPNGQGFGNYVFMIFLRSFLLSKKMGSN